MASVNVAFTFHSGIKRVLFQNVRLSGSWDVKGIFSGQWTQTPMLASSGRDRLRCLHGVAVSMDAIAGGNNVPVGRYSPISQGPRIRGWWYTEVPGSQLQRRQTRSFILSDRGAGQQDYWFATGRRFGAQKYTPTGSNQTGNSFFGVGALCPEASKSSSRRFQPHRRRRTGYIADNGTGMDPTASVMPLTSNRPTGIWETEQ